MMLIAVRERHGRAARMWRG